MTVLFTGSFDPPTRGHEDIIRRLSSLFDEVRVVAFLNKDKKGFFPPAYRLSLLERVCKQFPNVRADISEGFVIDYARKEGISLIVRGVRGEGDIAYEKTMADYNRKNGGVETLLLTAYEEYDRISSGEVRRRLLAGEDARPYLPEEIAKEVAQNWEKNRISAR